MRNKRIWLQGFLLVSTALLTFTGCSKYNDSKNLLNEIVDAKTFQSKMKQLEENQNQNLDPYQIIIVSTQLKYLALNFENK